MNERERRGYVDLHHHLRDIFFCTSCNKSSVFERREDTDLLVCKGDNRLSRPGCGHELRDSDVRRHIGDCLKCKKVRRVTFCLPTMQYICLYCWCPVKDVSELPKRPRNPTPLVPPSLMPDLGEGPIASD